MPFETLATTIPPGPGLPIMWWVFWWVLAAVVFFVAQWWWSYLGARHDRDLHEEAREELRKREAEEGGDGSEHGRGKDDG